jgi:hypothetical protein
MDKPSWSNRYFRKKLLPNTPYYSIENVGVVAVCAGVVGGGWVVVSLFTIGSKCVLNVTKSQNQLSNPL